MLRRLNLSTKLIGGFIISAFITLVIGFLGWSTVTGLNRNLDAVAEDCLPSVQNLLTIKQQIEFLLTAQRTLLIADTDMAIRKRQYDNVAQAREKYNKAWSVYDGLPKTPEEARLWEEIKRKIDDWKRENDLFFQESMAVDRIGVINPMELRKNLETFKGDHQQLLNRVLQFISFKDEFTGGEDPAACNFGKWSANYRSDNPAIKAALAAVAPAHRRFHQAAGKIRGLMQAGDAPGASAAYEKEMVPAAREVFKQFDLLIRPAAQAEALFSKMYDQALGSSQRRHVEVFNKIDQLSALVEERAERIPREASRAAGRAKFGSITGMAAGFGIALCLGIFLALSISRPIKLIISQLMEGADQIASASSQVSSASQSLAQGASEQAAAIEETSASLEEMNSMTRQNADNAGHADTLTGDSYRVAEQANRSMEELTAAMAGITAASDETAKIIKTVDEIAFQTNLLALNAAVEAARAGEAGAGFAVVADEVRSLAQRAAEAARNTSTLIETTLSKVHEGSALVQQTAAAFGQVGASALKTRELVGEISAASREQAQGVDQISRGVSEMDKVVQQNAAAAEQSASSSEQLSAQAGQMKVIVGELVELIGGAGGQDRSPKGGSVSGLVEEKQEIPHLEADAGPLPPPRRLEQKPDKRAALRPGQVILQDDQDVRNFG